MVKNLWQGRRPRFDPWMGKDPLKKGMATHSSILAGEFHAQRRLVGYNPWDQKQSDRTE